MGAECLHGGMGARSAPILRLHKGQIVCLHVDVMSIDTSLAYFGMTTLDQATPDTLRRAFATAIRESHPDRGGNETQFDEILSAYACLTSVLKRQSGGRDGLPCLDIEEVQQTREQQWIHELNNSVYDVLDSLSDKASFQREFNEQFEKFHVSESKGYDEWLKEDSGDQNESFSTSTVDEWNQEFEKRMRRRIPVEHTTLIFMPDEMAYRADSIGSSIIEHKDQTFTSQGGSRPEYTDLRSAYTTEHTMIHKLPVFSEERPFEVRMEDCMAERERVYELVEDRDGEMIHAYEKKREKEEAEHKRKITEYFQQTASSQWALRGS